MKRCVFLTYPGSGESAWRNSSGAEGQGPTADDDARQPSTTTLFDDPDDRLLIPELESLGWEVRRLPWRPHGDWRRFDLAVVRSTWDYHLHSDAFLARLGEIEASGCRLENCLPLIRWNAHKTYLADLEGQGIPVVETRWLSAPLERNSLDHAMSSLDCGEVVLKPTVSANARHTYRLTEDDVERDWSALEAAFSQDEAMLQPFLPAVAEEGEFSLIYFDGRYSHAGLKRPRSGDFRVQEDFGGVATAVEAEPNLIELGAQVLGNLEEIPLYARIDWVRSPGGFRLMELELVEPSLFLGLHPQAARRLAQAIDRRWAADRT